MSRVRAELAAPPSLSRLEQVRSKALRLFAERGFARVGMRELALHLGMGAGSFYYHFESKEHLLFELIEELYTDLLAVAQARTEGSAHARLQALLQAHIDLHERRALHFSMAEQELRCLSPSHQQQIRQMRRDYESRFLALLLEAGATGSPAVLKATVHAVVAWLNNLPGWLEQSGLEAAQQPAVVSTIVLGCLSGVLPPAEPAARSAPVLLHTRAASR